jgi:hypothetical protein
MWGLALFAPPPNVCAGVKSTAMWMSPNWLGRRTFFAFRAFFASFARIEAFSSSTPQLW